MCEKIAGCKLDGCAGQADGDDMGRETAKGTHSVGGPHRRHHHRTPPFRPQRDFVHIRLQFPALLRPPQLRHAHKGTPSDECLAQAGGGQMPAGVALGVSALAAHFVDMIGHGGVRSDGVAVHEGQEVRLRQQRRRLRPPAV